MSEPPEQEHLDQTKQHIENHTETSSETDLPQQKRRSGILKGTFVLPLLDDFDEPLEDFEHYMK